ncbi:hypothetical protein EYF80_007251 [Liparis tanakae]|uniref:Uncharacterized protein n=1 Tax=Liparis tanakae TaxID=230148 RepID=A0A4Z2IX12_9TELE|nr:hypothetical protein EYF80_007251 [Liparis tanakae]
MSTRGNINLAPAASSQVQLLWLHFHRAATGGPGNRAKPLAPEFRRRGEMFEKEMVGGQQRHA